MGNGEEQLLSRESVVLHKKVKPQNQWGTPRKPPTGVLAQGPTGILFIVMDTTSELPPRRILCPPPSLLLA